MQVLPKIIDSKQTLYSAVPLALDIQYINHFMEHLNNPYGDCQLFSDQELPNTHFKFMNKSYSVFNTTKSTSVSSPFSTILVGPAYACTKIMKSFEQWAIIDKQSLVTKAHTSLVSAASPSTKKKPSITTQSLWQCIEHPVVWSQATFSTVTVTSTHPQKLESELQTFFDFPITVHPIDPISSGRHNELAAWLTAIYALIVARNLYRTVLCHSKSWMCHLQFFTKSSILEDQPYLSTIPKLWKPLMCQPSLQFNPLPAIDNDTYNRVQDITQFQTRTHAYTHKNIKISRIIGIGHATQTILTQAIGKLYEKHKDFTLILKYSPQVTVITLPINASKNTKLALRSIASNFLNIDSNSISLLISNSISIPKIFNYTILANMLIHACKHIKPPSSSLTKTVSLTQCTALQTHSCSASAVVEFDVALHSREPKLRKAHVVLNAGYVANRDIVLGMVENIFYRTYFSLCGNNNNFDTHEFPLNIELLNEHNRLYSSSIAQLVKHACLDAFTCALSKHKNTTTFPTLELGL